MIKKAVYIIEWLTLLIWNLPTFLRKPKQIAWISAFTAPLNTLYDSKQLWRESIRYKLMHNGQIIYLEKVLNEYFNIPDYDTQDHENTKEIYIGEGDEIFPIWLSLDAENDPVYLALDSENDPVYTPTDAEVSNYASFSIYYPDYLTLDHAQINALVKYYIDTRPFTIKTYTL